MLSYTKTFGSLYFMLVACCIVSCKQPQNTPPGNIILDSLTADMNPYISLDKSPMDVSYYPVDYPLQKMNHNDSASLVMRVLYSRPHKKNRTIFGNTANSLCQYGKEWRLGANEATEIEFFRNVSIGGSNVSKGRYVMYCIPYADRWNIILNSNLDTWGLHIDSTKDVLHTEIPVQQQEPKVEDFTMLFQPVSYGADLLMTWDNVKAVLPVKFSKQ